MVNRSHLDRGNVEYIRIMKIQDPEKLRFYNGRDGIMKQRKVSDKMYVETSRCGRVCGMPGGTETQAGEK